MLGADKFGLWRHINKLGGAGGLNVARAGCMSDDCGVFRWPLISSLYRWHSARADGTSRSHAGSIGGQLAVVEAKVPAALALAIFSGTFQRET